MSDRRPGPPASPPAPDPNLLFARAESAFQAGRLDDARADLATVTRLVGDRPNVLHLVALVEKRSGNADAADAAFRAALRLTPHDPQINGNYANLLDAVGRPDDALAFYGRAIAAAPRFVDARLNRALLLQRLGRHGEALADLDAVVGIAAADPRLHTVRGGVLRDLDRLEEAAAALDAALALAPRRPTALALRARLALERGEPDAVAWSAAALAASPGLAQLHLTQALALEVAGDPAGAVQLAALVENHPEWVEGHEELTRMRAEAGEEAHASRSYDRAVAQRPDDTALRWSHWRTLVSAGRFHDALAAIDAAHRDAAANGEGPLIEAVAASEAGDLVRAEAAFARVPDGRDAVVPRARHALRRRDPASAAAILERAVADDADDVAAWAYLSLAWRLQGDPRAAWLCEQPGCTAVMDLGLAPEELESLATLLRTLHRTRAHPIGQSLRGGTQTRGRLFARPESELATLRERIEEAVRRYADALPPFDAAHPLLRHRDAALALAGSWSVRLGGGGFHVHHVHPQGLLSSAFYVALPPSLGGPATREGWLELGAPPHELGLDLPPVAVAEPRPGRLVLFPSFLFHGTRPFAAGERLTVAFDVRAG